MIPFICQITLRVGKRQAAGWKELDLNGGSGQAGVLQVSKPHVLSHCALLWPHLPTTGGLWHRGVKCQTPPPTSQAVSQV